ncbi:MAG: tyrosine-type recombinase/integrase [Bacteroidota bacterium]
MPIPDFLKYLKNERRVSPHTLTAYTTDLQQFVDFMELRYEQTDLVSVHGKQIRQWIVYMLENGKTPRTTHRKLATLKAFYKYLRERKGLETDPMLKVIAPKVGKRLPSYVEEPKMEILLEDIEFPDTYSGQRDYLMIELMYMTGLRRSELIQLTERDIDYSNGMMRISGKGKKQRLVPLVGDMTDRIQAFLTVKRSTFPDAEYKELFYTDKGKPLYPKLVYNIVNRYLSKVTTTERRSPHTLRHSFATHLSNNGAELNAVKELLGHSSLASTQVYTHNSIEQLKKAYKQAHPKAEKLIPTPQETDDNKQIDS